MRLARRGDTIYFLVAERDSSNFRLIRTEKVSAADVRADGLRLFVQTKDDAQVQAVWKNLTVRAEKLSGLSVGNNETVITELDRQRDMLPDRFSHQFTREPFSDARFYRWGFVPATTPAADGLRVRPKGSDTWTSAGLTPHIGLRGDFDMSIEFNVVRMDAPKPTMNSAVYFQLELPVDSKMQCSVIHALRDDGEKYVSVQIRLLNADGKYSYPSLYQEATPEIRRMRIARRGSRLYFLASGDLSQPDRLLASYHATDADIPDGLIHMLVHTGGADRLAEAAFKSIQVHAQQVFVSQPVPAK
jgi:hypothetical protein